MTLTAIILTGAIVMYAPAWGDLTPIATFHGVVVPADHYVIAHWDRDKLGWVGTLTIAGQSWPVVVGDYTHPRDVALVRERDIIAEVPHALAAAAGFARDGRTGVGIVRDARWYLKNQLDPSAHHTHRDTRILLAASGTLIMMLLAIWALQAPDGPTGTFSNATLGPLPW